MYIHRERRVLKLIKYNIIFTHIKSDINNTRNYYTLYIPREISYFSARSQQRTHFVPQTGV